MKVHSSQSGVTKLLQNKPKRLSASTESNSSIMYMC